jgi:hypothetical protein
LGIFSSMNANAILLTANPRLTRIVNVSTVFRWFFLVAGVFSTLLGIGITIQIITGHRLDGPYDNQTALMRDLVGSWIEIACRMTEGVFAWFCFRLFAIYSRGELFTPKIVHYIRLAGCAYLLKAVFEVSYRMIMIHPVRQAFAFSGWEFPAAFTLALIFNLVPGFLILFIAWVSDEGRKIQEEQELTV